VPLFDENYYINEARSIIHEAEITHSEHPPLGKLFIAGGISVFGDNPWGWRIPSVIFSTASILIFYFICRRLMGKLATVLASVLFTFETLTFFISGLAMLDVFSLTFMLLAFLFYLQNRYVFSGVALALSALCKMTGLLGVLVIIAHWILTRRKESPRTIAYFLASTVIAFMLLMPLFDFAATREWISPIDRLWDMAVYAQELTYENSIFQLTYPWEWMISPAGYSPINYPDIIMIINSMLFILIIPSMGYMVYEFIKNRTNASLFAILWFSATYLFWIPLVLATDRVTYIYYFVPTTGAVCIAIGFALSRLWEMQERGHFTENRPLINLVIRRLIQVVIVGYLALYVLFFFAFGYTSFSTPVAG